VWGKASFAKVVLFFLRATSPGWGRIAYVACGSARRPFSGRSVECGELRDFGGQDYAVTLIIAHVFQRRLDGVGDKA